MYGIKADGSVNGKVGRMSRHIKKIRNSESRAHGVWQDSDDMLDAHAMGDAYTIMSDAYL